MPVSDEDIKRYEGLVFKTATLYDRRGLEDTDLDELRQIFRIRVWRALESYDPRRSELSQDRYVFSCLVNQGKDLLKKKKKNTLYIEDIAPTQGNGSGDERSQRDRFEAQYLTQEADEIYGLIDEDGTLIPNTLSDVERRVVCLLWANYNKGEVQAALDLSRREFVRTMESIRTKMADWQPAAAPGDSDPQSRDERLAA